MVMMVLSIRRRIQTVPRQAFNIPALIAVELVIAGWIRTSALRLRALRLKFSNTRRGHSYFSGNGDRRTVTGERKADIIWFLQLDRRIHAARRLCQSRSTVRLLGPKKAPTA